jgi:hypothetical protein
MEAATTMEAEEEGCRRPATAVTDELEPVGRWLAAAHAPPCQMGETRTTPQEVCDRHESKRAPSRWHANQVEGLWVVTGGIVWFLR